MNYWLWVLCGVYLGLAVLRWPGSYIEVYRFKREARGVHNVSWTSADRLMCSWMALVVSLLWLPLVLAYWPRVLVVGGLERLEAKADRRVSKV